MSEAFVSLLMLGGEPCGVAAAQSTEPMPGISAGLLAVLAAPFWAKGAPTAYVCVYVGNSHQAV